MEMSAAPVEIVFNSSEEEKMEKAETTPSTIAPDDSEEQTSFYQDVEDQFEEDDDDDEEEEEEEQEQEAVPQQLQAGLFVSDDDDDAQQSQQGTPATPTDQVQDLPAPVRVEQDAPTSSRPQVPEEGPSAAPPTVSKDEKFRASETFFIFDYDDTILPSTWVQRQGLRLDAASKPTAEQMAVLAEVAISAGKLLRAARQNGTVILVTNAERGWIELSCQKFMPTLAPMLENVKLVSARTTYEGPLCKSPLDWKLFAFAAEISKFYGADVLQDDSERKNVFSLGDSVHEREALLRATTSLPNCCSKSLKFVERPDISQVCKQHELIFNSFDNIVHHQGHLDLCIRCP